MVAEKKEVKEMFHSIFAKMFFKPGTKIIGEEFYFYNVISVIDWDYSEVKININLYKKQE